MAKEKTKISMSLLKEKFDPYNSIASIISIVTFIFLIGWYLGQWRGEMLCEWQINELKYENLQLKMELNYRTQDSESDGDVHSQLTYEEFSLFMDNYEKYKLNISNE